MTSEEFWAWLDSYPGDYLVSNDKSEYGYVEILFYLDKEDES